MPGDGGFIGGRSSGSGFKASILDSLGMRCLQNLTVEMSRKEVEMRIWNWEEKSRWRCNFGILMGSESKGIISGLPWERVQERRKSLGSYSQRYQVKCWECWVKKKEENQESVVKKSKGEAFQGERSSQPYWKVWLKNNKRGLPW